LARESNAKKLISLSKRRRRRMEKKSRTGKGNTMKDGGGKRGIGREGEAKLRGSIAHSHL